MKSLLLLNKEHLKRIREHKRSLTEKSNLERDDTEMNQQREQQRVFTFVKELNKPWAGHIVKGRMQVLLRLQQDKVMQFSLRYEDPIAADSEHAIRFRYRVISINRCEQYAVISTDTLQISTCHDVHLGFTYHERYITPSNPRESGFSLISPDSVDNSPPTP